jgi:hypothetical protein
LVGRRRISMGRNSSPKHISTRTGVVVIFAAIAFLIYANVRDDQSGQRPTAATTTSRPLVEHPIYGEEGVLRMDGGSSVPVTTSQAVYDRLQQLANVDDVTGIEQLMMSGNVWMIENGTRVLVIDTDWTRFEVRILEGDRAGSSGFVHRTFVCSR